MSKKIKNAIIKLFKIAVNIFKNQRKMINLIQHNQLNSNYNNKIMKLNNNKVFRYATLQNYK